MNIFNSLGSHYNLPFAVRALLLRSTGESAARLKSYLEFEYRGKAILVYKGREAIELALRLIGLPRGTRVAVNGFTCFAVYKAIADSGYTPVYVDIEEDTLNFSPEKFLTTLKREPGIKILIIQNTLGYPCRIEDIANLCRKHKIILIEDLAHSVGAIYASTLPAGSMGDFVVFSFSRDKIIDGISGGALIVRNKAFEDVKIPNLIDVARKLQVADRLYPLGTYLIRNSYPVGIGKALHSTLKSIGIMSSPVDQHDGGVHGLPGFYCGLIYNGFSQLQHDLRHRRAVAVVYARNIPVEFLSPALTRQIANSTNLRFSIFVPRRDSLIRHLKAHGVHVADIWYDAPVAPRVYLGRTNYVNQCPVSERVAARILNLPTHLNVSTREAVAIARLIQSWQTSA